MRLDYQDLRGFIARVAELGALRHIAGADPEGEIGGLTEIAAGLPQCPALLFDGIKGYPHGFRIFTNATVSPQRAALALGIDPGLPPIAALAEWKARRGRLVMHEPATVKEPAFRNSRTGAAVDIAAFPAPLWHRGDGGRYIGSGSVVVMRDPDTGWVNAAIYRIQVQERDRVTIQFDHPGRHGAVIARRWWQSGRPCPVAIVHGPDPSLFVAGFEYLPEGVSEYAFAGAIKDCPLDIVAAPLTGLPVPAHAEIVFEGELLPASEVTLPEGPFGEFTGYYASEARPAPVMQVAAVHWRDDPILLGSPPMKPPRFHFGLPLRAAAIWSDLERCGVADVVGAWQHVAQLMTVVALRQRYAGHAKRALLIAAAQSYMARIVVVVDEDVDPSDLADVMWAVATRCEPAETIDIIRNGWSSALDPRIVAEAKDRGDTAHSKLLIDACKPFAWKDRFPPVSGLDPDEKAALAAKWAAALRSE